MRICVKLNCDNNIHSSRQRIRSVTLSSRGHIVSCRVSVSLGVVLLLRGIKSLLNTN